MSHRATSKKLISKTSERHNEIMKKLSRRSTTMSYSLVVALAICPSLSGLAGWTGSMNGSGYGKASVNVTSATQIAKTVSSATMTFPSAAMVTTPGYSAGGTLPDGSSAATTARILGQSGYIWKSTTTGANGDKADNATLTPYVSPSTSQATTALEVLSVNVDPNGCGPGQALYTFMWHWMGSENGTAQMVRFFEFNGIIPEGSTGDVGTLPGAVQIGNSLLGGGDCGPIIRPNAHVIERVTPCGEDFDQIVTYSFCGPADTSKLFMVTDGIAVSLPCEVDPIVFAGFKVPLCGADATGGSCASPLKSFKLDSTIPIKMVLTRGCSGNPVLTGNHKISVTRCGPTPRNTPIPNIPNNLFQLCGVDGKWKFDLNPQQVGMTAGTWKISATLSDGQVHVVYIALTTGSSDLQYNGGDECFVGE